MAVVKSVLKDLSGQRFGRLVVLEYAGSKRVGKSSHATRATWRCRCDCGVEVIADGQPMKLGKKLSCGCLSRESRAKNAVKARAAAPRLMGPDHPNWNHDMTDEQRQVTRKTSAYAQWRAEVMTRDDYTCRKCGQRGGKLCAHHLASFRKNPELRHDASNGATLCVPCHKMFHSIYGVKKFTPQDFAEYCESKLN